MYVRCKVGIGAIPELHLRTLFADSRIVPDNSRIVYELYYARKVGIDLDKEGIPTLRQKISQIFRSGQKGQQ